MDQHNYREQYYRRTEERIKLHSLVFRSLLNLLLITIVGTVTVFATRTQTNWGSLIILGSFATLVLVVACIAYFVVIRKEINSY